MMLQANNLKDLATLRHGFFTSAWGDCGAVETENRARIAEALLIAPDRLLSCYQIHSPDVVTVTEPWQVGDRPRADALVTKETNLALGILTADCVPLLFANIRAGVIGAAHAGWKGAISGVIENTLQAMEKLGANRKHTHVALGPCIWQNSYEVGIEFPAPFLAENLDNERFFRPAFRSDHWMFNLPAYVEAKLRGLGVGSVESSPADTASDETRFFSYRRSTLRGETNAGRLISAIVQAD